MVNNQNKYSQTQELYRRRTVIFYSISSILTLLIIFLSYTLVARISSSPRKEANIIPTQQLSRKIQVEVLNGCGVEKVGDFFTDYLRKTGFDVISTGNYISFDMDNTLIIDRAGNISNALVLADSLGINKSNVIQQIQKELFLDVTIIIGKDFNLIKNKAKK